MDDLSILGNIVMNEYEDPIYVTLDECYENHRLFVFGGRQMYLYHYFLDSKGNYREKEFSEKMNLNLNRNIAEAKVYDDKLLVYAIGSPAYNLFKLNLPKTEDIFEEVHEEEEEQSEEQKPLRSSATKQRSKSITKAPKPIESKEDLFVPMRISYDMTVSRIKEPKIFILSHHVALVKVTNLSFCMISLDGNKYQQEQYDYETSERFREINVDLDYCPLITFTGEPRDVSLSFPFLGGVVGQSVEVYNIFYRKEFESYKASVQPRSEKLPCAVSYLTSAAQGFFAVSDTQRDIVMTTVPSVEDLRKALSDDLLFSQAMNLYIRNAKKPLQEGKLIEIQQEAGFKLLFRAQIKKAFAFFLQVRRTAPKYHLRMDVRELLHYFTYSESNYVYYKSKGKLIRRFNALILEDLATKYTKKMETSNDKRKLDQKLKENTDLIPLDMNNINNLNLYFCFQHKAMVQLCKFLEQIRDPLAKFDSEKEREEMFVIEYALISLYTRRLYTDPEAYNRIEFIFRGPNVADVYPITDKHPYITLLVNSVSSEKDLCTRLISTLFMCYKNYKSALGILLKYGDQEVFRERFGVIDDAIEILKTLPGNVLLSPGLKDYISWVIAKNPTKSIEVFTSKRAKEDEEPDPKLVLECLAPYPNFIKQCYLEELIYKKHNTEERIHTEYALCLIENIIKLLPPKSDSKIFVTESGDLMNGVLGKLRSDLMKHLKESDLYNRDVLKQKLEDGTCKLYDELVEVYRKIGEHKKALKILCEHKNFVIAANYCEQVFKEEKAKALSKSNAVNTLKKKKVNQSEYDFVNALYNPLFRDLIEVFLERRENQDDSDFLNFLNARAGELNAYDTLRNLPDEIKSMNSQQFLLSIIKFSQHQLKQAQTKEGLAYNSLLKTMDRHAKATARNVKIDNGTFCTYCQQPISTSVFVVFPNLQIVHYKCLRNKEESKSKDLKEKDLHVHPRSNINFKQSPWNL